MTQRIIVAATRKERLFTMKIHRDDGQGLLQVNQYGSGYIEIGRHRYTEAVSIVGQEVILVAGGKTDYSSICFEDLEHLLTSKPEVVLLGTGRTQGLPNPRLMKQFHDLNIGCDIMDTGAACRTYNILTSEGRNVAAWLLIP